MKKKYELDEKDIIKAIALYMDQEHSARNVKVEIETHKDIDDRSGDESIIVTAIVEVVT